MNQANLPNGTAPATPRLLSLDALRGFDMFWIVGAEALVRGLRWPRFRSLMSGNSRGGRCRLCGSA